MLTISYIELSAEILSYIKILLTVMHDNLWKTLSKEGKKVLFSEMADSFQGIPHSRHSSQVFIIPCSFNEYTTTCCSLRYFSIRQKKLEYNNS